LYLYFGHSDFNAVGLRSYSNRGGSYELSLIAGCTASRNSCICPVSSNPRTTSPASWGESKALSRSWRVRNGPPARASRACLCSLCLGSWHTRRLTVSRPTPTATSCCWYVEDLCWNSKAHNLILLVRACTRSELPCFRNLENRSRAFLLKGEVSIGRAKRDPCTTKIPV
jgi:hypothetical protein